MITRFVKLSIQDKYIKDFREFTRSEKKEIIAFEGCVDLEIYQDINNPSVFFTKSIWHSEDALNKYRDSDFFRANWVLVKTWFNDKAQAWSLNEL